MEENYLDIVNKTKENEIANIKKCNEYTSKYGVVLSDNQMYIKVKQNKLNIENYTYNDTIIGGI